MIKLGHLFQKYSGWLRRYKGVYVLNNLLNIRRLQHNKHLYRHAGLRRSIYAPIGSHVFQSMEADAPWLDRTNAHEALAAHPDFDGFSEYLHEQLLRFIDDGYMILKGFFDEDAVERLNTDIERLLHAHRVDFNYTGRKIMESYRVSDVANKDFFRHPELLRLLSFVMGRKVIPFHTINFISGSEQRAHSDSIHMSTEPKGYLIAAWIALEDCTLDNGPLFFYPGSHRLPYITCQDYDAGNTRWTIGAHSNSRYEDKIAEIIDQANLEKQYFLAKKGDVLIWHANLIHGGAAIQRPGATRKSMVAHYFCEGVICYHEISQRPALLELNH